MTTERNTDGIRLIEIEKEMRSSYLDYAMSVIISRALPDVRDGLKPVQRRILYAMHDQGMRAGSSYKKSARLVGEVLGKYHPHSDTAVYDALVRMAQSFSMLHPLVDGQGNYGSVDGDPPAAMRYTECRLARIASTLLADIDKDTVDWNDNFDQSLQEPTVLPARLPNLLVNGTSGIAVGMATNIPPHNLSEVCDAVICLIDNPNSGLDELMEHVRGPDFPTGAHIWGVEGMRSAYSTGRGAVIMQAETHFEETNRGVNTRVVATELPYQVNKANLVSRIANLIKQRQLEGAYEVRDESDRKGLRVVIELRRGTSPDLILNNCYRYTDMRKSFNFNVIALVEGVPKTLALRQALQQYIGFRQEVARRRAEFDLKKTRARLHILEGLRIAIANLDEVIRLIRSSESVEMARSALMTRFDLSEIQAQAILDMQLRRLAALEREKIDAEYKELTELAVNLENLLARPERVLEVVKEEVQDMQRIYGQPRRTRVHQEELGEWRREDMEPRKEVVITLSRKGYVKRVDSSRYRAQHRGGRGVKGQVMTKEGDVTPWLQVADTHDFLLFFTSFGRVLGTRVFELPADQSRKSRGTPVQNVVPLETKEEVNAILAVESLTQDLYLVMGTRRGVIKRMHLPLIRNLRRQGLRCFKMRKNDKLMAVSLVKEDQDVVIVTKNGMAIRFCSADIRAQQRVASGVRGITLDNEDVAVGMCVANPEDELLVVTKKGYGKISSIKRYRVQKRGGKGLKTLKITDRNGEVAATAVINPEVRNDSNGRLFLLTERAQVLRTNLSEIRSTGRITQGVKLVIPDSGDNISAIRVIAQQRPSGEELDEAQLISVGAAFPTLNGNTDVNLFPDESAVEETSAKIDSEAEEESRTSEEEREEDDRT